MRKREGRSDIDVVFMCMVLKSIYNFQELSKILKMIQPENEC